MNFVDKLKEELKEENFTMDNLEPPDDDSFVVMVNKPRTEMTDEELGKEYECIKKDISHLADAWADSALLFYDKLKGKYTGGQIVKMVEVFFRTIGGNR